MTRGGTRPPAVPRRERGATATITVPRRSLLPVLAAAIVAAAPRGPSLALEAALASSSVPEAAQAALLARARARGRLPVIVSLAVAPSADRHGSTPAVAARSMRSRPRRRSCSLTWGLRRRAMVASSGPASAASSCSKASRSWPSPRRPRRWSTCSAIRWSKACGRMPPRRPSEPELARGQPCPSASRDRAPARSRPHGGRSDRELTL